MSVLVDEAIWPWRGRRWAHLVSDQSYDELHEAARRIGKRRLGFQGDHYDVDEIDRERAIANGATAIGSRKLVRRLKESGLRNSGAKPSWARVGEWPDGVAVESLVPALYTQGPAGELLAQCIRPLEGKLTDVGVALFADGSHIVVLLELASGFPSSDTAVLVGESVDLASRLSQVVIGEPRVDGDRSIELFMAK